MSQQRFIIFAISVAFTLLFMCACSLPQSAQQPAKKAPNSAADPVSVFVTPVRAAVPRRGDISAYFETTSRIEAETRVEVVAKGAGACLEVLAEVGEFVKEGQPLIQLEKDEIEAQLRQAAVQMEQQRTAFEIAERSFAEGIGSSVERDNARFGWEQARASVELVEIQLRNQTVRAPISGVVTQRAAQKGLMIGPGMPVFVIVDPDSFTLPIHVPEKELERLEPGQRARARIDAFPDREFTARVWRIHPSIDSGSGTVRVQLAFDAEDRPLLRESAFARVRLVMETRENALLVPRDAVFEEDGRSYMFVLDSVDTVPDGVSETVERDSLRRARRVEITTGIDQSDVVEVVSGGDEALPVVIMGRHSLKDDALVSMTTVEQEFAVRAGLTAEEALTAAGEAPTPVSVGSSQSGAPF